MKYLLPFLLIFLLCSAEESTCKLVVNVTNLQTVKGNVDLRLFDKAESFPKDNKHLKIGHVEVKGKTVKYTFKGLKKGDYALVVYHDENKDGECNTNAMGYPTEAYGFSRNVRPFLSAPSFKSTKIKLNADRAITIKVE